jgi:16S rRNA (uracil1498-N3)-methyltransferase
MQLYHSPLIFQTEPFSLSEEESRHAISVLRHKLGDRLHIIDGKGQRIITEIISPNPKNTVLKYLETVEHNQKPNNLHIAISPTKSNDRIEWFIEKACEIGIGQITPLICQRTERAKINLDRWNKIVVASCKQAQQLYFPIINEPMKLNQLTLTGFQTLSAFIHVASITSKAKLTNIDPSKENIILIGPEGDFSEEEFKLIRRGGEFKINEISLGSSILRVETAGLVAVSQWNSII